jgi:beta-CASP RNase J family ribonuclease
LLLLADSTNAERPGFTPSERTVGQTIDGIVARAEGRVLVASFASQIHRILQVVQAAVRHGRRVAVVGRSMENVVQKALELGYLEFPPGTWVPLEEIGRYPKQQILILTTGSQGEPMSALTRMSTAEHKKVEILPGDTVIISATPIPGNEKYVARTVDNLYRRGAHVYYGAGAGIHVSGHACQEELKLMLTLVHPRFFIPVHGEYRHLVHHAELARSVGMDPSHVVEMSATSCCVTASSCPTTASLSWWWEWTAKAGCWCRVPTSFPAVSSTCASRKPSWRRRGRGCDPPSTPCRAATSASGPPSRRRCATPWATFCGSAPSAAR